MFNLTGRVAIITGGAMGNGRGGAEGLAKQGATVVLADISPKVFDTAKEFEEKGFKAFAVQMDVTKPAEVKKAIDQVIEKYGRIDILFNNAGVMRFASMCEESIVQRDFMLKINVEGMWNVAREVFPHMVEQNYGRIINTSSVTGIRVADAGSATYAMSKCAIIGLTKGIAMDGAQHHITCNAICPGIMKTNLYDELIAGFGVDSTDTLMNALRDSVPVRRPGTPDDIGALVAFLASEEASYITGTEIVIDGGETLYETTP